MMLHCFFYLIIGIPIGMGLYQMQHYFTSPRFKMKMAYRKYEREFRRLARKSDANTKEILRNTINTIKESRRKL